MFSPWVGPGGALAALRFKNLSLGAVDASDRILWNPTTGALTGALSSDADGAGGVAAVRFATVLGASALTAAEFLVI